MTEAKKSPKERLQGEPWLWPLMKLPKLSQKSCLSCLQHPSLDLGEKLALARI